MNLDKLYKDFKEFQHNTKQDLQNGIDAKDVFSEEFPSDVFPKRLQNYIKELSNEKGYSFDPAFVGLSLLKTYATAIGSYYAVKTHMPKPIMFQLFGCIVGISSAGKSIVESTVQSPLIEIDERLSREYEEETYGLSEEQKNSVAYKSIFIRSAHIQTMLGKVLPANPKGVIRDIDEISEFFKAIDAKKSSSDAAEGEFYMSIFNGKPFSKQLAKQNIKIPFGMMTMVGSTQPEIVHEMFKNQRGVTGFIYRFLFAVPRENLMLRQNIFYQFPEELSSVHRRLAQFLYQRMPVDEYKDHKFNLVILNNEAKKLLQSHFDGSYNEIKKTEEGQKNTKSGIKGKLSEYIYKFTGILAIMDFALSIIDDTSEELHHSIIWPKELTANADHVDRAIRLVRYFENAAMEVTKMATDYVIVDQQVKLYIDMVRSGWPMWKRGAALKGISEYSNIDQKKKNEYSAFAYRQEEKFKKDYPEHFRKK